MTARTVLQVFEEYQKARLHFVQSVADLSSKSNVIECLVAGGAMDLLRPLLSDVVPSIRHTAAISLGRLANHDDKLARAIIKKNILPDLLENMDKQNKYYKKGALYLLRSIAKHSPEMASIIVQRNGLETIIYCLEDFDSSVKEAAAWAVGYIARHNKQLAQAVIDAGAVPLLVQSLQEPELCLKQINASALCDISKHSSDVAQSVVDAGAIPFLAKALSNPDAKLKRQVLSAFASIAKHSVDLAETVIEAEVFPEAILNLAHPDENVARAAATLTKEICQHSRELAEFVVNIGGIGALVDFLSRSRSMCRMPAIMALGYIAGHSDQFAAVVIGSKGVVTLAILLQEETEDLILAITVWALGQIGKHTAEHAKAIAAANIFPKLIELYINPRNTADLQRKCHLTLKQVLQKCMFIEALEPLLIDAPANILKYILGQFAKVLPNDAKARRLFVTSGGLRKVQEIQAEPASTLSEYITVINCCFPEEIVRYYTPGYPDSLLEAVEQYQPDCSSIFPTDRKTSSNLSDPNVLLSPCDDEAEI